MSKLTKENLFIILGQTNAGKTTLVNKLTNINPKIQKLVTTTDRPKRPGEINNIDYHFVKPNYFKHHQILAPRSYHVANGDTWTYGIDPKELHNNMVLIIDYQGFKDLDMLISSKFNLHAFYLDTPVDLRRQRAIKRHDDPKEANRRIKADLVAFKGIEIDPRVQSESDPNAIIKTINALVH